MSIRFDPAFVLPYEQICPPKPTREELHKQIEDTIRRALAAPPPPDHRILYASAESYHQILEGLFLGNGLAFLGTLMLEEPEFIPYKNLVQFTTVITACPKDDLDYDFPKLENKKLKELVPPDVQWFHVGKSAFDLPEYWPTLVHDCTYPDSTLAQYTLPAGHTYTKEHKLINRTKQDLLNYIPVQTWFSPIFNELDKAVFEKKMVLVHCRAGISRSASILAAYLISRFNMSAVDAIDFLQRQRACVNPQFKEKLEEYARLLAPPITRDPTVAGATTMRWVFPGWDD